MHRLALFTSKTPRSLNRWLVWLSDLARYHRARSRRQPARDESALILARQRHESALITGKLADVFAAARPQGGDEGSEDGGVGAIPRKARGSMTRGSLPRTTTTIAGSQDRAEIGRSCTGHSSTTKQPHMPDGHPINSASTFLSIRSRYLSDPAFPLPERWPGTDVQRSPVLGAGRRALANAEYGRLFPN
jgi:hypothetical protein